MRLAAPSTASKPLQSAPGRGVPSSMGKDTIFLRHELSDRTRGPAKRSGVI